jgi:hypothetical protein
LSDRSLAGAVPLDSPVRPRVRRRLLVVAAAAALWSTGASAAQTSSANASASSSSNSISNTTASSGRISVSVDDTWAGLVGARAPVYTGVDATLWSDPASGRRLRFGSSATRYGSDLMFGPAGIGNDYSAEFEVDQPVGQLSFYALGGYQIFGAAPGFAKVGGSYATIGASYPLTANLWLSASLDADESLSSVGPERSMSVYLDATAGETWKLQSYLTRGLAAASTDWRVGFSVAVPW